MEDQEINQAVQQDNMTLSVLKQHSPIPKTYAEEGASFISNIHEMDSKRLMRLKADLEQQANDHQTQQGVDGMLPSIEERSKNRSGK
jgi:hypothetical protein